MNTAADPLATLRDIHLPEAVSFWPLAPGWWGAAALLIVFVGVGLLILQRRRQSLRRAALRELDSIERSFRIDANAATLAERLSSLLRRFALTRFRPVDVAALHGVAWSEFLSKEGGRSGFSEQLALGLERTVYGVPTESPRSADVEAWIHAPRRWIGRAS